MDTAEHAFVDRLLAGDEGAFEELVATYQNRLLRLARVYCRTDALAADVVQETWLAVIRGLSRFERRSSLRAWLFQIVANRARTHATREGRWVTASDLGADNAAAGDGGSDWFDANGAWRQPPAEWPEAGPEGLLLRAELRTALLEAIDTLPEMQRAVVTLRDLEGMEAQEACNILGISETNQRVLLHRGRTRLRTALAELVARSGP
ncbi:MAG: sigma-70 family RNA polymerase sigma factor [Acidobacteriota bacterium]